MRDLSELSNHDLENFFASFDVVLSDVDGVLWNVLQKIPGADDAITSLRKLNKQIILLTSNTSRSIQVLCEQLKAAGFEVEKTEIVNPILNMISYLRNQDLGDKKIFVLGMTPLKQALLEAGFKLAENAPDRIKEAFQEFATVSSKDDGSVGAVIADIDLNVNYVKLQKAAFLLERPEVVFLCGARDEKSPIGKNRMIIGWGSFIKILETMTGREAIGTAKRSSLLREYITEKFSIKDCRRVLYIGDSIPEDMAFATQCGYKKLLVLSGLAQTNDLEKWSFPEEYKPDFYVGSLKTVNDLIMRVFSNHV